MIMQKLLPSNNYKLLKSILLMCADSIMLMHLSKYKKLRASASSRARLTSNLVSPHVLPSLLRVANKTKSQSTSKLYV